MLIKKFKIQETINMVDWEKDIYPPKNPDKQWVDGVIANEL